MIANLLLIFLFKYFRLKTLMKVKYKKFSSKAHIRQKQTPGETNTMQNMF